MQFNQFVTSRWLGEKWNKCPCAYFGIVWRTFLVDYCHYYCSTNYCRCARP